MVIRGKTAKRELSGYRSGFRSGSSSTNGPTSKTRATPNSTLSTLRTASNTSQNKPNPHILNDTKGKLLLRSLESGLRVKPSLIVTSRLWSAYTTISFHLPSSDPLQISVLWRETKAKFVEKYGPTPSKRPLRTSS